MTQEAKADAVETRHGGLTIKNTRFVFSKTLLIPAQAPAPNKRVASDIRTVINAASQEVSSPMKTPQ